MLGVFVVWELRGSEHSRQVSGEGGMDANRNFHSMAISQATPLVPQSEWPLSSDTPDV